MQDDLSLPGSELVTKGLSDLARRDATAEALLVSIGARRLAASGHVVTEPFAEPELRLYALLAEDDANSAHGRYNALLRKLSSYARAAECVAP
ncbi:hypothetical protein [Gaiella sp.]|uniref:hypothetical protein n=1 Tax=Gaiella sp. TaxID=2663207 RepID=UPI002E2EFD89|nr:hypothetical protein [Gaiella sp.]HEX5583132.1 hypothetical protein [Gaiella sp.]